MIDLKCKDCGRHIGEVEMVVGDIRCPNSSCKASTQFKILNADMSKMYSYKFAKPPKEPKKKEA